MILVRSPLRVSLAGGFGDVAAQHCGERHEVLSVAIRLYASILVAVERDGSTVASYSRIERVERPEHLQNSLFRETLAECGIDGGVQVHSVASIPLSAGGLGGSGAACVSLVNALHRLRSVSLAESVLAETACRIEIERLGRKVGRQDQYAAAYGGLNRITFDGPSTHVERLDFAAVREMLEDRCLLIPCLAPSDAPKRDASALLAEQLGSTSQADAVKRLSELVQTTVYALDTRDAARLIACVNAGWDAKRTLSPSLSTTDADLAIDEVRRVGGGAKLCGAGGGGYVFAVFPDHDTCAAFRSKRSDAFDVGFDSRGSTVVYDDWERIGGPPARERATS